MEGGHVPQDCRMAMDYINDKQFISEVKKFPNLYNAKLPSYTKRAKRRDAWASIAKSFGLQGKQDLSAYHLYHVSFSVLWQNPV